MIDTDITNWEKLEKLLEGLNEGNSREIDVDELTQNLKKKIVGQDVVCERVAEQIYLRFAKEKRTQPIGVFMVAGPPATGKTYFGKVLGEALYGENNYLLIEMAQYSEAHTASTLFGSPQGYVGGTGQLTSALKAKPDQVIILDEFEKAHPEIQKKFLNAWNDGFVSDVRKGEKVSTTNAIFIVSTNAAQQQLTELANQYKDNYDEYIDACKRAVQDDFPPEIISRLDYTFPIMPVNGMDMARIVQQLMVEQVKEYGMMLEFISPEVLAELVIKITKEKLDPRAAKRLVEVDWAPLVIQEKKKGVKAISFLRDGSGRNKVLAVSKE